MISCRHRGRFAGLLFAILLGACGRENPPVESDRVVLESSSPWTDTMDCSPLAGEPDRGGDLVLALGEPVDPARAPVPSNTAERTVFANLYETLTLVDCDGELLPGLAESWQRLDDGRRWRLRLRAEAVFWDGTPVTADDVVRAWAANETLARDLGRPCPGLWLATDSRGLLAVDGRTLEIRLPEAQDDLPRLLAHPDLAVAVQREGWLWQVGSGPCRLAADSTEPLPDVLCRPNLHHPQQPAWTSLRFRCLPERDARELLDSGTDLAVVRDRRAAEYYDQLAGVRSAPLPWDRLYVLLLPPGREIGPASLALAAQGAATVAENRPWRSLDFHGCRPSPCPQLQGPTLGALPLPLEPDPALPALGGRRLAFRDGDPDARALAERAAAFLGADLELEPRDGPALALALQTGNAGAYVVRLDACYPTACLALAAMLSRADWLQREVAGDADACAAGTRLMADRLAVPLVATRGRLVWRSPLAGLALTHDGALLVGNLGRAQPAETP